MELAQVFRIKYENYVNLIPNKKYKILDVEPWFPHEHSPCGETLQLPHLREGILQELRPEEAHQEAPQGSC